MHINSFGWHAVCYPFTLLAYQLNLRPTTYHHRLAEPLLPDVRRFRAWFKRDAAGYRRYLPLASPAPGR